MPEEIRITAKLPEIVKGKEKPVFTLRDYYHALFKMAQFAFEYAVNTARQVGRIRPLDGERIPPPVLDPEKKIAIFKNNLAVITEILSRFGLPSAENYFSYPIDRFNYYLYSTDISTRMVFLNALLYSINELYKIVDTYLATDEGIARWFELPEKFRKLIGVDKVWYARFITMSSFIVWLMTEVLGWHISTQREARVSYLRTREILEQMNKHYRDFELYPIEKDDTKFTHPFLAYKPDEFEADLAEITTAILSRFPHKKAEGIITNLDRSLDGLKNLVYLVFEKLSEKAPDELKTEALLFRRLEANTLALKTFLVEGKLKKIIKEPPSTATPSLLIESIKDYMTTIPSPEEAEKAVRAFYFALERPPEAYRDYGGDKDGDVLFRDVMKVAEILKKYELKDLAERLTISIGTIRTLIFALHELARAYAFWWGLGWR